MLEARQLTKAFEGKTVVHQVSFEVAQGHTLALLGTSGSGKTTTLKMLNMLIAPTGGSVWLNGQNLLQSPPAQVRRQMGYVIQGVGLFPHYTIAQNIALVPQLLKWPKERIAQRTAQLMDMLDLPMDYLRQRPAALSGGQRQRVGIARALAANPPVVLLDEPLGALDPITRRQIQQEFATLPALKEKTMVMVTHDVFEAFALGNQVALMDQGRLQQIGTAKELLFNPANDFVRAFFNAQRFLLELSVVRLQEVLPFVQGTPANHDQALPVPQDSTLLVALEKVAQTAITGADSLPENTGAVLALTHQGQVQGHLDAQQILPAFYKLKPTLAGAN